MEGSPTLNVQSVTTVADLPSHAVYMPTAKAGTEKLPVIVWGNGGCSGDGSSNAKFLQMLASHGYLAIASGAPGGRTSTTAQMMTASIDFVTKAAGKGDYANVDASKIMAAGFSCGGVEAMAQSWDPRVKSIGIFSSGLLTNYTAASTFAKPVLFVLGGSSDIAYANVCHFCPSLCPSSSFLTRIGYQNSCRPN
jgi:dienelactone hydrolase